MDMGSAGKPELEHNAYPDTRRGGADAQRREKQGTERYAA